METKVWYYVINGGDGSAYPQFVESKELGEMLESFEVEGWAEDSVSFITIESDSPIKVKDLLTLEKAIEEYAEYVYNEDDQKKVDTLRAMLPE